MPVGLVAMLYAEMQGEFVGGAPLQAGRSAPPLAFTAAVPVPAGAFLHGSLDVLRVTRNLVFCQGLLRVCETVAVRFNGIVKPIGEANPRFGAPPWGDA